MEKITESQCRKQDHYYYNGVCIACGESEDIVIKEAVPLVGSTARPPMGIKPRWVLDQYRGIEILEACIRYVECRKKIPTEWIDELICIDSRTKKQ